MAVERSGRRSTGKREPGRDGTAKPETTRPMGETRCVDFDPWAMLAELMETPEEEPTEGRRPKGK